MMPRKLKLKQASAVLQVHPKELQNLVQFGVLKPKRSAGTYVFGMKMLVAAKVALYLKESLGTRTNVLSKLIEAFNASEKVLSSHDSGYVVFNCRLIPQDDPLKLSVPFRALEEQVAEGMSRADLYKDLPRGRKRRGWKKEFLVSLSEAAKDIGEISEDEVLRAVRTCRRQKRAPEITVAAES